MKKYHRNLYELTKVIKIKENCEIKKRNNKYWLIKVSKQRNLKYCA